MKMIKFLSIVSLLMFYAVFTDASPPIVEDNGFNIEQSIFNPSQAIAEINTVDFDVGISETSNTYSHTAHNDFGLLQGFNSFNKRHISPRTNSSINESNLEVRKNPMKTGGIFYVHRGK